MANVLSGTVDEVGEGFIVLGGGIRSQGMAQGDRVTITARLRGAEWVADDIQVQVKS